MPHTYIDIQNGFTNMVTVQRMPQIQPKVLWHCSLCDKTGGKLGFAGEAGLLRFDYCGYCDEATKQITVKA